MGIENRSYYRDEGDYGYTGQFGSGSGPSTWTMISILIAINVIVFVIDMFTPVTKTDAAGNPVYHLLGQYLSLIHI